MTKFIYSLLIIFATLSSTAQSNRWIDYYSYLHIKQVITENDRVVGVAENSFFTYDLNSSEIERFSSINGLSGDDISKVFFHQDLNKIFVIHKDGLIEIIDEQKNINQIPDLQINTFISEEKKKCNFIESNGNILYLAMDYGISVFDLNNEEFNDTFYIGNVGGQLRVYDIRILGNTIYATTNEGLKKADMNTVLLDFNNWQTISGGTWNHFAVYNNKLIISKNKELYELNGNNLNLIYTANSPIYHLFSSNDYLGIVEQTKISLLNASYFITTTINNTLPYSDNFLIAEFEGDNIYIGTRKSGIQKTKINNSGFEQIAPNCPLYNDPFGVDVKDGHIWVVYGKHSTSFNPHPLQQRGISHNDGSQWSNIYYDEFQLSDLCYIQINPADLNQVYISSAHNGLLKIDNGTFTKYDDTNSPIEAIEIGSYKSVRVFGIKLDEENNLWLTQTGANNPIKKLKNDGNWQIVQTPGIFTASDGTDGVIAIDIDKDGLIWFGTSKKGVLGINKETGQFANKNNGSSESSTSYIKALAIDKNNTMWIGNYDGVKTLSNPKRIFENPATLSFQPIKIEFEGSVQLLLQGQEVTKILVDGSNNKWIGTSGSGVYYVSDDGKKTIFHFTKDNSPLPSNEIYDIDIDGKTGTVYFATGKGLLGFKGNATDASDNLDDVYAFPNPVNTKNHEFVTIRGLVEGVHVKIVDVEGNLVYETQAKGGSIDWDLTAFGKYKVASGVYIALITDDDGEKIQTTKILVIR